MFFCRLLSMLVFAFFSSLSWSLSDTMPMPPGNDVLPGSSMFDVVGLRGAQLQIQSGGVQGLNRERPRHSYPLKLTVASVPVEAKQEVFSSGLQVLTFDLRGISRIQAISEIDSSVFEQLLFILSRSSKTVAFHFYPLTQTAEIKLDKGLQIGTQLTELEVIRRDLPEPLNLAVASQLLLAANCALETREALVYPTQCYGGVLDKLGKSHVFFEPSTDHALSLPEWQVQSNSTESLELNLNATTQLILTLDDNGIIVKGDVIRFDEPADMMEEDDEESGKGDGNKSRENKDDKGSQKDTTPPPPAGQESGTPSANGGPPGGGPGDDGDKDEPSGPVDDEEEEEEEVDEEDSSKQKKKKKKKKRRRGKKNERIWEDGHEDACHWDTQDRLMGKLDQKAQCRSRSKPKDRSLHQLQRLQQKNGVTADAVKHKVKPKVVIGTPDSKIPAGPPPGDSDIDVDAI